MTENTSPHRGNTERSDEPQPRTLARSTRASYAKYVRYFHRYCEQMGVPALPASPAIVAQFIGAAAEGWVRVRPGTPSSTPSEPLAPTTLDAMLSAVRDEHLRAGLPDPTQNPGVKAQRYAYRKEHIRTPTKAEPMTVADLEALCWPPTRPTPSGLVQAAVSLLMLDHGLALMPLVRCVAMDLRLAIDQVVLRVDGHDIAIACRCALGQGTEPWHEATPSCASCLLRLMEQHLVRDDQLLFDAFALTTNSSTASKSPATLYQQLRARMIALARHWRCVRWAGPRLAWAANASASERAASRHALMLAATGALEDLLVRVVLLLGFTRGLRFDDLARRIRRSNLNREGWGYRLLVPSSKGDQGGRGVWARVPGAQSCARCAVCCLDEWLAVAEVAVAPPGSQLALCAVRPGVGLRRERRLAYPTFWFLFDDLQKRVDLPVRYTTHSLRRGFAAEAKKQGADLHSIRAALRHRKLDTTAGYLERANDTLPAGLARLAGLTPAEPNPQQPSQPKIGDPHTHRVHANGCRRTSA